MTALTEASNLISKRKGSAFLGCTEDPGSKFIVLTFDSIILLIQLNDNRIMKMHTCTKGRKNTSSAVFNPEEQEYVVVQSDKIIRTFKEADFDDAQTFTLKHKIHSLIQCERINPLVLLVDGSLFHLHHVLEDPQEIVPDSSINLNIKNIVFTTSIARNDGTFFISSICELENNKYTILASTIHHEEDEVSHCTKDLEFEGHKLRAASAYNKTNTPSIATVWSDGSLCLLNINIFNSKEINVHIDKITTIEIDENVSMTSISPDQVAVLSRGQNVSIIDLKFGTVLQSTEIGCNVEMLTTIRENILLETPSHIQKIPFTSSPVTLSSVILKQRHSQAQSSQLRCAKWSEKPKQTSLLNEKDNDLVEILLKTAQEANFDRSWTKFWKSKSADFKKQFCRSNTMKDIVSRFGTDENNKIFWPRSTIMKIVTTGLINGSWCNKIFQQIFKSEDWDFLRESLKNLNDIPENIMIQCLTFIAATPSKNDVTESNGDGMEDIEDGMETENSMLFPPHADSCINEILQLPYSEHALRKELSSVPFNTILKIVLHLTSMLEDRFLESEPPTLNQVINWLSLIIDAHLSEIIMLEDSWPAISKLEEAVELQGKVFTELTAVSRLLTQIQSNLPAGKSRGSLYTVEIMKF